MKALLLTFVFWSAATFAATDKTFIYCSEASPSNFNPQTADDGPTINATSPMLFNRLVEFQYGTAQTMPGLAESWDVSKSGKVYTFHLRKDVWFHSTENFQPTRTMNADDVLFSFNRMRLKDHPFHRVNGGVYELFQTLGFQDLIEDIVKVDDHTVRFVLSRPEAPFLSDMALSFAVVLSKEYGDHLLKIKQPGKLDTEPVGTGPFILKRYVKDTTIRYEANPRYFRGPAKLQKVVFLITPDPSVRYQKLKAGECHLIAEPSPVDIKSMRGANSLQVMSQPGANIGYLAINIKKKPFDNLKVRQAIAHALNLNDYISIIFQGTAIVAKSFVPPTIWASDQHLPSYDYNIEKAKTLLKEAGFPNGFDTDLWTLPVSRPYNPNGKKMGELMQADLAKIGIRVNLVTYDWPTYLEKTRKGEHSLAQIGWIAENADPDNFVELLSCQAVRGGGNLSEWCSTPFDNLINSAKIMSDNGQRLGLYTKAQEMIHGQVPVIAIDHATVYRGLSKKVSGYQISPLGIEDFYPVDLL